MVVVTIETALRGAAVESAFHLLSLRSVKRPSTAAAIGSSPSFKCLEVRDSEPRYCWHPPRNLHRKLCSPYGSLVSPSLMAE